MCKSFHLSLSVYGKERIKRAQKRAHIKSSQNKRTQRAHENSPYNEHIKRVYKNSP